MGKSIAEVGRSGRKRTIDVKVGRLEKDDNFRKLCSACYTRLCSDPSLRIDDGVKGDVADIRCGQYALVHLVLKL